MDFLCEVFRMTRLVVHAVEILGTLVDIADFHKQESGFQNFIPNMF